MIKKIIICKIKYGSHRQDSDIPETAENPIFKTFSQQPQNAGKYDLNNH